MLLELGIARFLGRKLTWFVLIIKQGILEPETPHILDRRKTIPYMVMPKPTPETTGGRRHFHYRVGGMEG